MSLASQRWSVRRLPEPLDSGSLLTKRTVPWRPNGCVPRPDIVIIVGPINDRLNVGHCLTDFP